MEDWIHMMTHDMSLTMVAVMMGIALKIIKASIKLVLGALILYVGFMYWKYQDLHSVREHAKHHMEYVR